MTVSVLLLPLIICAAAAPGDRYEVRVKYFHPMHFDTVNGRYVLELPTVVPKVRPGRGACAMTAILLPLRIQSWGLCAYHWCARLEVAGRGACVPIPFVPITFVNG
jgi:hypothetical protein